MSEKPEASGQSVGTRWPELIVAAVLMVLAALVIIDSLRVGIGWAEDGPRSGYFPFYIGMLLLLSSGSVLVRQLLKWRSEDSQFAERSQIALVIAVLVPMVVYVGLIALLGIYLASFALIAYFMRRHGRYGWLLTGSVAVGVPLFFFIVFERWFLVPLPKGPIENLLGF
jgi:putative tricarboxylic transport membrane protein